MAKHINRAKRFESHRCSLEECNFVRHPRGATRSRAAGRRARGLRDACRCAGAAIHATCWRCHAADHSRAHASGIGQGGRRSRSMAHRQQGLSRLSLFEPRATQRRQRTQYKTSVHIQARRTGLVPGRPARLQRVALHDLGFWHLRDRCCDLQEALELSASARGADGPAKQ